MIDERDEEHTRFPVSRRVRALPPLGDVGRGVAPIRDPDVMAGYLGDASGLVGNADALFRPENEAELAQILREAAGTGVAVSVVAGQTSTTGSSMPMGGWIISTECFDRILEIDASSHRAVAEAGVMLGVLQDALEARGCLYPPDPTSRYECALGGSIACNASGPRSFFYGATRRWVKGLRVVLASGDVLELSRGEVMSAGFDDFEIESTGGAVLRIPVPDYPAPPAVKHAAGYPPGPGLDLIDLFIGSEGTLGVISRAELALVDAPGAWLSFLAFFPNEASALAMVDAARSEAGCDNPAGLRPRCIEYFDAGCLAILREESQQLSIPPRAAAALFIEDVLDSDALREAELLEAWLALLTCSGALVDDAHGVAVAMTAEQREALRKARHAVPAGVNQRALRNGMPKLGTDLAVPDESLRAMMALYHQAAACPRDLLGEHEARTLMASLGHPLAADDECSEDAWKAAGLPQQLDAVSFGHIGDNHLHVNFLPRDEAALALARAVYRHLTREALSRGGSPSAEHGIGKIKHEALEQLVGKQGIEQMRAIKRALDPEGCLGRDNLFGASSA